MIAGQAARHEAMSASGRVVGVGQPSAAESSRIAVRTAARWRGVDIIEVPPMTTSSISYTSAMIRL
jgi:hypothetical protein